MRMRLEDNEALLQDDNTETSDVEVKDILFADVNDHFLRSDDDICYSTYTDQKSCLDTNMRTKNPILSDE